jgi:predicted chitinase
MPQARTQLLEPSFGEYNLHLSLYEINKLLRLAAFIAQGAHESCELQELLGNMYDSTPELMMAVWPSRLKQ